MNIMFVSSDNDRFHGAFLSMVKLASLLQDQYGHKIIIVVPYEGNGAELIIHNNIRCVLIPSKSWVINLKEKSILIRIKKELVLWIKNRPAIRQMEKLIQSEKIDIVHVNTSWTYVGAIAAIKQKTRLIWHIREFLEEDQGLCIVRKRSGYKLMDKADRIVTISTSLYQKYTSILHSGKIEMIHNGIDPEHYYDPSHTIMQEDRLSFLIVGNVVEWKRQGEVIHVCLKLIQSGFNSFTLTVIGEDISPYAENLKKQVKDHHAEKYIIFGGQDPHPEKYYKTADITFMCSVSEAFGRVTVEAMLGGALVIGAESAGTKDIINNGITGLMYKSGNEEDLYNQIKYAVDHKLESRQIARAGREDMLMRMTAEINADKTNDLYNKVL